MRLVDILANMKSDARRKLAGQIVMEEIPRQGLNRKTASTAMYMSPGTLDRIRDGDPTIQPAKLRSAEGALKLPRRLLTYIWEGDADSIAAIEHMDADLRRVILDALARIDSEEVEHDKDTQAR